jgi:hypothetical protein
VKTKTYRVGWIVPKRSLYARAMPSTRIRAYDAIRHLKNADVKAGLFRPFFRFDIVIFQKAFSAPFLETARSLKRKGIRIVFDVNVNYLDPDPVFVTAEQRRDVREMLSLADAVICPGDYLVERYRERTSSVYRIDEIIDRRFFGTPRALPPDRLPRFVFSGFASKTGDLEKIADILTSFRENRGIETLLVCERDPGIQSFAYRWVRFRFADFPKQLLQGDIAVAPRDLERKYNLGHTFTRIGCPMALGLPVAASPVPSYRGSPALLCESSAQWDHSISRLLDAPGEYRDRSLRGIEYVQERYAPERIVPEYLKLFETLLSGKPGS